MVKHKCPHLPLHLPHVSLSQINTPVFSVLLLNHNSPVSSLLQLLPNVLKTGYLHLNTNRNVWHPPPTRNDIPVSYSIKIVDPKPRPLITHISQKSWTPSPCQLHPRHPKHSPLLRTEYEHIFSPFPIPTIRLKCWTFQVDFKW